MPNQHNGSTFKGRSILARIFRARYSDNPDHRGGFSDATLIIGSLSLLFALLGGAKLSADAINLGISVVTRNPGMLLAKSIVLGLANLCGWVVSLVGVRKLGNIILPVIINIYCWLCSAGASVLYIVVIIRLYLPYTWDKLAVYMLMIWAGLAAAVGLHLILEQHDLTRFAIPLVLTSVFHLGTIVHRYVLLLDQTASLTFLDLMDMLARDMVFFLGMVAIGTLMLLHLGMLASVRQAVTLLVTPPKKLPPKA
jgi:hypothetical protein